MKAETFYLNILYDRGDICYNLNEYLKADDGRDYLKCLKLCFEKEDFLNLLKKYPLFPSKFNNTIFKLLNLENLSIDKISVLFSSFFNLKEEELNFFVFQKKQFEYNFLVKNYDAACDAVMNVYNKLGVSLWLVDCVCMLNTLKSKKIDSIEELAALKNYPYYSLFELKNNITTKHNYYIKQMEDSLRNFGENKEFEYFIKYILFVSVPKNEIQWKYILMFSSQFSLVDMYLATVDFLHGVFSGRIRNKPLYSLCKNLFSEIKNTVINVSTNQKDDIGIKCIESFDLSDFSRVINDFYSIENRNYDSISLYILTAISYLLLDSQPESFDSVIFNLIVELMYKILKRNEHEAISAIFYLATIARLLKSFSIHKGICVFLSLVAHYNFGYNTKEMFVTNIDYKFLDYIKSNKNITSYPFVSKLNRIDDEIYNEFIEKYINNMIIYGNNSKIYFKECFVTLFFEKLIKNNRIEEATNLFVNAYIENKLLVYTIDVSLIVNYIVQKIKNNKKLTLDEVCYIFIDSNMNKIKNDGFLDLFDQYYEQFPIEIVNQIDTNDKIKNFFLYEVCKTQMLSTIYLLFLSTEEAENYRIIILQYLINHEAYDKKILMDEIEDITKRRTLAKKLKKIEESKIIINTKLLRESCFDLISEKVALINNTSFFTINIERHGQIIRLVRLDDKHRGILESLYSIYCKEFCFGDFGLDTPLSTRIRHGTFSNQVLKVFSDNELVVNGHGRNKFFNKYIQIGALDDNIVSVLIQFNESVNEQLDCFVQKTLKVFVDTPIEGAVFDFRFNGNEIIKAFGDIFLKTPISADEVISLINLYLIEKTKTYLSFIRNVKIKELENNLIITLDKLLNEAKKYYLDKNTEKDIERKIITCKTDVQNVLRRIANWFVLSDYNDWEPFSLKDIIETCVEIDKKLFSGFEKINIKVVDNTNTRIKGIYFREWVDIILIILNNAISHSGYIDNLFELSIVCELKEDTNSYYFSVFNNLHASINITELDKTIDRINTDYECKRFLELNIHQEGGMGLYKIMHIMHSLNHLNNLFYINRNENIFRIELHFKKEIAE